MILRQFLIFITIVVSVAAVPCVAQTKKTLSSELLIASAARLQVHLAKDGLSYLSSIGTVKRQNITFDTSYIKPVTQFGHYQNILLTSRIYIVQSNNNVATILHYNAPAGIGWISQWVMARNRWLPTGLIVTTGEYLTHSNASEFPQWTRDANLLEIGMDAIGARKLKINFDEVAKDALTQSRISLREAVDRRVELLMTPYYFRYLVDKQLKEPKDMTNAEVVGYSAAKISMGIIECKREYTEVTDILSCWQKLGFDKMEIPKPLNKGDADYFAAFIANLREIEVVCNKSNSVAVLGSKNPLLNKFILAAVIDSGNGNKPKFLNIFSVDDLP